MDDRLCRQLKKAVCWVVFEHHGVDVVPENACMTFNKNIGLVPENVEPASVQAVMA